VGAQLVCTIVGIGCDGSTSTRGADVAAGTRPAEDVSPDALTISYIENADADADVERAWLAGDKRLIGVYGFSRIVPEDPKLEYAGAGVRYIEGTSDFRRDYKEQRLNEIAWQYARWYNRRMIAMLKSEPTTAPAR
jgi:hypothetical protein